MLGAHTSRGIEIGIRQPRATSDACAEYVQDYLRDLPKINATADPQALINTLGWVPQYTLLVHCSSEQQLQGQGRLR